MIRNDNCSNNALFLSCQMGLSDGAFFMIKHTPLPDGNHPVSSPIYSMGVADTLGQELTVQIKILQQRRRETLRVARKNVRFSGLQSRNSHPWWGCQGCCKVIYPRYYNHQGRHGEFEPGKFQYSNPNFFDRLFLIRAYWKPKLGALPVVAPLRSSA